MASRLNLGWPNEPAQEYHRPHQGSFGKFASGAGNSVRPLPSAWMHREGFWWPPEAICAFRAEITEVDEIDQAAGQATRPMLLKEAHSWYRHDDSDWWPRSLLD